jgi:hypothetical protein
MGHSFDAKTQIALSTGNPVTGNHTCGSGATVLVLAMIYEYGSRTGTPTFNGVSLVQADIARYYATSPEACCELWYLIGPPTGSSYEVSIPNPNALNLEAHVSSYSAGSGKRTAFEQAIGFGDVGLANYYWTSKGSGCLWVGVTAGGYDTWAPTGRSGTAIYDSDNGTWGGGSQYYLQTNPGQIQFYWSGVSGDDYGVCLAIFNEVQQAVNVSKLAAHVAMTPAKGVSTSKVSAHVAVRPAKGVAVSKVYAHVVLTVPTDTDFWPVLLRLLS